MDLIEAFKIGAVENIKELPSKIIDTQLSSVFIFTDKAIKVYKKEDAFFGNLGESDFRKGFYFEDFSWNKWMSPEIYLALKPVRIIENGWKDCSYDSATDFYIEMNKVNIENDLSNLLVNNAITKEQLKTIGLVMIQRILDLTRAKRDSISVFNKPWKDLLLQRQEDLRNFSYIVGSKISKEKVDIVINKFVEFVKGSSYITDFDDSKLEACIDNHSDNILLNGVEVAFIDIYLVKENWRGVDPLHNICRTMADVCVLSNRENTEAMFQGYLQFHPDGPNEVKEFYMAYNAMIKAAYCYMLKKDELAVKYLNFVDDWVTR